MLKRHALARKRKLGRALQFHRHGGALVDAAFDGERAAEQFHQMLGQRQAQSGAVIFARQAVIDLLEGAQRCRDKVAASLLRLGKGKKPIVAGQSKPHNPDPALIKAVVRAHRWFEMLKTRQVKSTSEIAKAEQLSRAYVGSLLPLAFLAPDIVESILDGRQPIGVSLDRMLAQPRPSLEWTAQRSDFGFAGR